MTAQKKGVLLINLGTPDSPETKDVRKYLREFLMDEKVIDIPYLNRWLLVNCIIAPLRSPKSAAEYKKVWTKDGSPLLVYGVKLKALVQEALGDDYIVELGMRYQNPTMEGALLALKNQGVEEITVLPLYPQFAEATTGSTFDRLNEIISKWSEKPTFKYVEKYPSDPNFIDAFTEIGKEYLAKDTYDHVMFSYHGLPERQIYKACDNGHCQLSDDCCGQYQQENEKCYRAQCFETSRALANKLGIDEKNYTVSFQSRLGRAEWVKPYTESKVVELAEQGIKNLLVFSPAFTADCLETIVEIAETYGELFEEKGGGKLTMVESLNDHPAWVKTVKELILNANLVLA